MSPVFESLSKRYSSVIFLKVDVDRCPQVSATEEVDNFPMFGFYKNQKNIIKISTSQPQALEDKLKKLADEDVLVEKVVKLNGVKAEGRIIISYGFHQAVKLHSLKIKAPLENGPKIMKFFVNLPGTLGFDQADSMEPVQLIHLKPDDLTGENPVPLDYVKFQNVKNLEIFVKDNQGDSETTYIEQLVLIGIPMNMTNE